MFLRLLGVDDRVAGGFGVMVLWLRGVEPAL